MIEQLRLSSDAPILDVGGGASGLAGELLARGYSDLTVADLSRAALEIAKDALGAARDRVTWVAADVRDHDFGRRFAVWHDRAVFHFMTNAADRTAYLETVRKSLLPGGDLIVATFGPQGPTSCSGLPVVRYGVDDLRDSFAGVAKLVDSDLHDHETPSGTTQQFLYAHLEVV